MDLDNDGLADLFFVNGSVYSELEHTFDDYKYKNPRIVFRNMGGGLFENIGARCGRAIVEPHSSRGCAFGDFDNDGDIDVVV